MQEILEDIIEDKLITLNSPDQVNFLDNNTSECVDFIGVEFLVCDCQEFG